MKMDKMVAKNLLLGVAFFGIIVAILGSLLPTTKVSAVLVLCGQIDPCIGTDGGDTMIGDEKKNTIDGKGGGDSISGGGNDDEICGGPGDDVITGGNGNDGLVGDITPSCNTAGARGTDRISGGPGDDFLFHADNLVGEAADGHRDVIDCGPGDDTAFINTSLDHDVATNCETIHAG